MRHYTVNLTSASTERCLDKKWTYESRAVPLAELVTTRAAAETPAMNAHTHRVLRGCSVAHQASESHASQFEEALAAARAITECPVSTPMDLLLTENLRLKGSSVGKKLKLRNDSLVRGSCSLEGQTGQSQRLQGWAGS